MNEPATKKDLDILESNVNKKIVDLDEKFTNLDKKIDTVYQELKTDNAQMQVQFVTLLNDFKKEIINHFDVVAENIHRDVAGANQNEIALIASKQDNHEQRITALERIR